MIQFARLEPLESGYRLYDFHYAGEIYPLIELTEHGLLITGDYGMDIRQIHNAFCAMIDPIYLYIYMPEKGIYYDKLRRLERVEAKSTLQKTIAKRKRKRLSNDQVEKLLGELQEADKKSRGYETDKYGSVIVQLRGKTCAISPFDNSRFLYLTFFGGFLGLHRFYVKKFPSALFYLFSCGGFMIGWFLDIVLFYSSRFKDGAGRLLLPDETSYQKLILLVFVSFIACFVLAGYLILAIHLSAFVIKK